MARLAEIGDEARQEDVAILAYSALQAAALAGVHPDVLEHLLAACRAIAIERWPEASHAHDARALTLVALQSAAGAGCKVEVIDALLDAVRGLEAPLTGGSTAGVTFVA